ncbi:hypothetical protein DEFDS_0895 [Deferribacter desulfuricans SSM1]|uniref:Uncharacterized protein n=1 Tax=Deferribacter desulfuricans (strain DSM 14783 / JCM 11476 / NBRC 101012 / SSM1) TaxID=639282 RepID=D3PCP6_DEFDS|nr:hypothetical protein [Deferribacter desulfuricans]BAI80369.1 hypothetical protein DEFDS_0895 [Deferribacter desulfuricans SSM1]
MLRVITFVANASVREQTEMESLLTHLRDKGYLPVIRGMFTGVLSLAKLPEPGEQLITKVIIQTSPMYRFRRPEFSEILGDLFFANEFVYLVNPLGQDTLQASVIGYRKQEEALRKFCADVEDGIKSRFDGRRVRGMKFNWKIPKFRFSMYVRRRYFPFEEFFEEEESEHEEELKGTTPNYSLEDIKAAELLVNTDIRRFMLRLAQVGKMTSKDAVELAKSDILERLLSLGLITEEYLLTCKQDQHTICVVPSKKHLTTDPMASLRCSICGRSFPEENLQVIYTLSERGKKLLDGSLWMSIWVTELLKKSGVKEECIKWGLEASGEELDIMVEDFDSRLFFELKDREFGLGDAYPFVYRTTRYGGVSGIIATMDKVSTDAKKFFEEETHRREYPIRIQYLEGPKQIQEDIPKIVEQLALSQARRMIQPFSIRIGFDLWPIVEYWLKYKTNETPNEEVAATADNSG